MERKLGGSFLPKLLSVPNPIAHKYREGQMKRTLKRELNVPETAEREAREIRCKLQDCLARNGLAAGSLWGTSVNLECAGWFLRARANAN